LIFVVVNNGI